MVNIPHITIDSLEDRIYPTDKIVIIGSDVLLSFEEKETYRQETKNKKTRQKELLYSLTQENLPNCFVILLDFLAKRVIDMLYCKEFDRRFMFHEWERGMVNNRGIDYARLETGIFQFKTSLYESFSNYERSIPPNWRSIPKHVIKLERRHRLNKSDIMAYKVTIYSALQLFEACKQKQNVYILTDSRKILEGAQPVFQQYSEDCQEHGATGSISTISSKRFIEDLKIF